MAKEKLAPQASDLALSILIPGYNEQDRIISTLEKIIAYLDQRKENWEIIFIDDGSQDATVERVEKFKKGGSTTGSYSTTSIGNLSERLKIYQLSKNSGKGAAIKYGALKASGSKILFTDADLSTPIEELPKLEQAIEEGYDIAIGSRGLPSSEIELHQPWFRETMGRTFNLMIRLILLKNFYDTQCGFKLFKKEAIQQIFPFLRIPRFAFDVEILYIAQKKGLKIKEIPVKWYNSPASKVALFADPIDMMWSLFKIRLNDFLGSYD